jgi:thiol-disulfide isomerase/thioredoxin
MRRNGIFVFLTLSMVFSVQLEAQYLRSLEGQPFPEVVLNSVLYKTNGDKTSLAEVIDGLKGKCILIDFWASWCKGCIAEAEYTQKIQSDYKEAKISFLFLSTDTEHKLWLRGLPEINLDGNHYRIEPDSKKDIQNFLKIRGIPYYVLLDNDGNIYDAKAPWPHLQKLRDEIDRLLSITR